MLEEVAKHVFHAFPLNAIYAMDLDRSGKHLRR
jgi:hypothetical protein